VGKTPDLSRRGNPETACYAHMNLFSWDLKAGISYGEKIHKKQLCLWQWKLSRHPVTQGDKTKREGLARMRVSGNKKDK